MLLYFLRCFPLLPVSYFLLSQLCQLTNKSLYFLSVLFFSGEFAQIAPTFDFEAFHKACLSQPLKATPRLFYFSVALSAGTVCQALSVPMRLSALCSTGNSGRNNGASCFQPYVVVMPDSEAA